MKVQTIFTTLAIIALFGLSTFAQTTVFTYQGKLNDLGVAGYVSKYLGKTMGEAWPKYKRRVNTSRSWPTLPDLEQQPGWMFRVVPRNREIWQVCENLAALGHSTFLASAEGAWTLIDRLSGLA